jgi:hypothetical protein
MIKKWKVRCACGQWHEVDYPPSEENNHHPCEKCMDDMYRKSREVRTNKGILK